VIREPKSRVSFSYPEEEQHAVFLPEKIFYKNLKNHKTKQHANVT
jgi:hypothetical protein